MSERKEKEKLKIKRDKDIYNGNKSKLRHFDHIQYKIKVKAQNWKKKNQNLRNENVKSKNINYGCNL